MTCIYNEFRTLAAGNADALELIDALQSGQYQGREAKRIADHVFRLIKPKPPVGRMHMRETFWGQATQKMVWKGLAGISAERHCAWIYEQRTKYKELEKPCLFVRIPSLPLPQTGK